MSIRGIRNAFAHALYDDEKPLKPIEADVKAEIADADECKKALEKYFNDFLLPDDPKGIKLTFV